VKVKWKEGQREQELDVVQFLVTEQQLILPEDEDDGGVPSGGGTSSSGTNTSGTNSTGGLNTTSGSNTSRGAGSSK